MGVPISARLIGLKPYRQYSATVSVLNLGQASDASDPVIFMTPEHGKVKVALWLEVKVGIRVRVSVAAVSDDNNVSDDQWRLKTRSI